MYFAPDSGNSYKHGPSNSYSGGYVPGSDVSASDAVVSMENTAPSKAMLEKFIKEIKYFKTDGSGPKGMPLIKGMQVEKMNPEHKAGFMAGRDDRDALEAAERLVAQFISIMGDKCNAANFSKWLGEQDPAATQLVIKLINSWNLTENQLGGMANMVRYLDMERRQKYVLEPGTDGLLYCREASESAVKFERKPFDTSKSMAAYGGRTEMAIWVQGPSGRFYSSNESETGKFHHSSFLAGRDVKAAGDWKVIQGKLLAISAISGHYHPTLESLLRALLDLQAVSRQLVSWNGVVQVYKDKKMVPIPIREFLDNAAKDSKYLSQFKPSD